MFKKIFDHQDFNVWHVDYNQLDAPHGLQHILSTQEYRRYHGYKTPEQQNRFLSTHFALRYLIGKFTRTSYDQVELTSNEFGKLYLKSRELYFNLSYSKNSLYIAFSNTDIGIDAEALRESLEPKTAINAFCHVEEQKIFNMQPRLHSKRIWSLWTQKQSIAKCLGLGQHFDGRRLNLIEKFHKHQYLHSVTIPRGPVQLQINNCQHLYHGEDILAISYIKHASLH